jgi:hypothetical protein
MAIKKPILDNGANEAILVSSIMSYREYAPVDLLGGKEYSEEFCTYIQKHGKRHNGGRETEYLTKLKHLHGVTKRLVHDLEQEIETLDPR